MYFLWNSVSSLTNSSEVIYIQQNSISKSNTELQKGLMEDLQIKRKKNNVLSTLKKIYN